MTTTSGPPTRRKSFEAVAEADLFQRAPDEG